ncbi:serine/threonine-protein phosphatase [Pseudonocardia kujensis]|uniref:PP2C family protein-serine/threonine phosphatase n=1 Tax=Pseudonocardia kujensis TaxID=1128675 RepID=UPI001E5FE469|nr:PP2C family protein-serine/threonine phosphatase [Pseudonocardia kujensis]MCE0761877.1 serine/threonine-protein phosphatase [Pseudonocardia kujensis]
MSDWEGWVPDLRTLLERVEAAPPVDAIDVAADELARMLGAREVSLLVADYSGRILVRLGRTPGAAGGRVQGSENAESVPLAGTVYEEVLRTQQVVVRELDEGIQVTAPVTVRGDAIGAMDLVLTTRPTTRQIADIAGIGHLLGHIVVVNRRYTDLFEWGQRTTALSLSAEIQRRLLPAAFTCEAGQCTLAGWLEPASTVGGDTFDYALDRGTLHLSITDAAGHDVEAAMLATVLVSALRNARRAGSDLHSQVVSANDELAAYSPVGWFVTGQVIRVDLDRESAIIVNAGHPGPLRLRRGRVEEIKLAIDMPFGLEPGRSFQVQSLALEPGDRIVFVTDGMLERHAADLDFHTTLRNTAHLHPREVVHALGAAVLRITGGNLRDDATVLCLDWYGGSGGREAHHGASQEHASP